MRDVVTVGVGETHVWTVRDPWSGSGSTSAACEPMGVLDRSERRRAAAFVRVRDRARYVGAHLALRRVLAMYLGVAPGAVRFGRDACPRCPGAHGRPVVRDIADAPYFSLSHSGGLAVVAVARVPVGVDVQRVPPRETAELVARRLHPEERREMNELPPPQRRFALASVWARKEAYLKGLGTGLAHGLGHVYLGGRPGVDGAPTGWLVRDLPGDGRHTMAVARHGPDGRRIVLRALSTGPVA